MKIIANGTKVLIFTYNIKWLSNQPLDTFNWGIITSSELTDKYGLKGKKVRIYTVLGDDGIEYEGPYGSGIVGGNYFRTPKDHIKHLRMLLEDNKEELKKIEIENEIYNRVIDELEKKDLKLKK